MLDPGAKMAGQQLEVASGHLQIQKLVLDVEQQIMHIGELTPMCTVWQTNV